MRRIKEWFIRKILSNKRVINLYRAAGREYGEAISYTTPLGAPANLASAKKQFDFWQQVYVERGFKPIKINDLVCYGGYDQPLNGLGERA